MNNPRHDLGYTIGEVERDTGLGKDTLRVWERRYGFPAPQRDAQGERLYSADTLARLRLICRLMLAGHRPGQLVRMTPEALEALAGPTAAEANRARSGVAAPRPGPSEDRRADLSAALAPARMAAAAVAQAMGVAAPAPPPGGSPDAALQALQAQDGLALRLHLDAALNRMGLAAFCLHWLAPMLRRVGDAWVAGDLGVHQEHLFSEAVQSLMRQAIYALAPAPTQARPRVLLATLPGEPHGLGLLMAEALLALEGCACVSLGVQTPVDALVQAAQAHRADVVALSASVAMPARQLNALCSQLRVRLPPEVDVWVGGDGSRPRRAAATPWQVLADLRDIAPAVRQWRTRATPPAAASIDPAAQGTLTGR